MKNYKLAIAAAVLAIVATEQAAQATLTTAASGTGTLVYGNVSSIAVSYDVVYDSSSSLFTYLYSFTPISASPIGTFNVNASYVNSVVSAGTSFTGSPYTLTGSISDAGISYGNLVSWSWSPYTTSTQFVGYTSYFGPTAGSGSLIDGGSGPWGDNAGSGNGSTSIPVPVPEASTVVAGALMLLPFGIGAVRSLRKERNA